MIYAIKTRNGQVYLRLKRNFGDMSALEVRPDPLCCTALRCAVLCAVHCWMLRRMLPAALYAVPCAVRCVSF